MNIKEIKALALQTHEAFYEPVTKCVFVPQMSNSVLVGIPIDENGFLASDQDAWRVGEQMMLRGGIRACITSACPQDNPVPVDRVLVRQPAAARRRDICEAHDSRAAGAAGAHLLHRPADGRTCTWAGRHGMSEEPTTGDVWVGLKGALKDAPCGKARKKALTAELRRCEPEALEANMALLLPSAARTRRSPTAGPCGASAAQVRPDSSRRRQGGVIYPCFKSPPMLDFRRAAERVCRRTAWTRCCTSTQNGRASSSRCPSSGESGGTPRITGPAHRHARPTARSGCRCSARTMPSFASTRTTARGGRSTTLAARPGRASCASIHIRLLVAAKCDHTNRIYALSSDLLDDEAGPTIRSSGEVCSTAPPRRPLAGGQLRTLTRRVAQTRLPAHHPAAHAGCACHRVAFVDADISPVGARATLGSCAELASSKLLQKTSTHRRLGTHRGPSWTMRRLGARTPRRRGSLGFHLGAHMLSGAVGGGRVVAALWLLLHVPPCQHPTIVSRAPW